MHNRNTKFKTLIEHAQSALGQSVDELKERYKDYPICLMEYIEKEACKHVIKIRFETEEATISISFDCENNCDASFLFLDLVEEEDLLINYLIDSADYSFRKSCFIFPSCSLKVEEIKNQTYFVFILSVCV